MHEHTILALERADILYILWQLQKQCLAKQCIELQYYNFAPVKNSMGEEAFACYAGFAQELSPRHGL